MSTLVDQARQYSSELLTGNPMKLALSVSELLLQLADRVQELEGKGEPVAVALRFPGDPRLCLSTVFDTLKEAQEYAESCPSKPVPISLYASPPSSVQPAGYVCENMLDELADGKRDAINLVSREGAELTGALGPADIPLYRHPSPNVQPEKEERRPLTEQQLVRCLVEAGCTGTVKMSFDSGPYEITRTSINADRFARAIEAAHHIGIGSSTEGGGNAAR